MTVDPTAQSGGARRTDFDLLRIAICLSVIFGHALLIFAVEPRYHLKSADPSRLATGLYEFMRVTLMPVFFVIAGWSAVISLRRRSAGRFLRERVTRLLVPLAFGTVLFGSVIKYIELRHGRDIGLTGYSLGPPLEIGFFEFFPRNVGRLREVTWSHLWFLAYLFAMSVMLLPLLIRLAKVSPEQRMPRAVWVYVPALVLAAILVGFSGYWPFQPNFYSDGANFAYFAVCFAIGAGMAAWPGFEQRLHAEAPRFLALLATSFAAVLYLGESSFGRVAVAFAAWGAIGAGLGYAARIRLRATRLFQYLSEATMPVYVVHHVPALLLGIYVLPLAIPVALKIALITFGTAAISFAVYQWLVRPWRPVRWLVGA